MEKVLLSLKRICLEEAGKIEGFMQLLMKHRNGEAWTVEDKASLAGHLQGMARTIPLLVVFSLPGGMLMLPVLAWFLDRRKRKEDPAQQNLSAAVPDPRGSAHAQEQAAKPDLS